MMVFLFMMPAPEADTLHFLGMHWYTRTPTVPVDIDGLRVGAPHPEALLDDLLDFWEVGLQGLVAEHFGKHLQRQQEACSFIYNTEYDCTCRKI